MNNIYFAFMFASVLVASFSQVLLKKSATRKYGSFLKEYLNPYVICGYGMLFASMILTILAYKGIDYKNGPVIEALGNIIVLILSFLFFREKIGFRKLIGMGLVVVGFLVFYL